MKPLNIRDPLFILIILALLFFLWGMWNSAKVEKLKRENDNRLHQQRVEAKQAEILILSNSVTTLKKLARERAVKDSLALSQNKRHISGLAKTVAELRKEAQPEIDSSEIVSEFVKAYDSLHSVTINAMGDMELRHSAQVVDLQEIIEKQGRQIVKEREVADMWRQSAEASQKTVRKLQRGKVFRNVVIGVLTGGIVFLSLRE